MGFNTKNRRLNSGMDVPNFARYPAWGALLENADADKGHVAAAAAAAVVAAAAVIVVVAVVSCSKGRASLHLDRVTSGVKGMVVSRRPCAHKCWSVGVGIGVLDPNLTSVERDEVFELRTNMLCSSMLR